MKQINLTWRRNQLMLIFMWAMYILDVLLHIQLYPRLERLDVIWPPIAPLLLVILTYLVIKRKYPTIIPFALTTTYYIYLFYLNVVSPHYMHYLFLFIGIIFSTYIKDLRVTIYSGILSITGLLLFFEKRFYPSIKQMVFADVWYFVLFAVFLILYFVLEIRVMNALLQEADRSEKQVKKELFSTQQHYKSFFNDTKDAIVVYDLDGKVMNVNPAFEQMYGWKKEEIINQMMPILIEMDYDAVKERWHAAVQGEKVAGLEVKHVRRDGKVLDVAITISPIYSVNQQIIALSAISRDITEQKKTEELLIRSEKLAMVGEMAAGVAHEVKNPLTVISGFVQMMQQDKQYEQYANYMLTELHRINLIMSEFLVLAKPQAIKFQSVQLKTLFDELFVLYDSQYMYSNVKMNVMIEDNLPNVQCEPNQLKQVLINLMKNAIEAIEENGTIQIQILAADQWVIIEVKDNGCGIPAHVLKQVYDPFFTTKDEGTGLGLMVTQGIIDNHQGHLEIISKEKVGTTVKIFLPIPTNETTV